MRTSKQLLLASRAYASEHRWRSWWHLWSTMAALAAFWTLAASELLWPLRLAGSVLTGLTLVRCFILFHDQQHGAFLRGAWFPAILARVFGLFTLNPVSVWRRSHDHHHRHNSKEFNPNIGSFPLMTLEQYAGATPRKRLAYRLSRHPLTIVLGYFTIFGGSMCLFPLLRNPRRHYDAALALGCHAGAAWLIADSVADLTLAWLLPFMLASAIGSYLFFVQHNFPGVCLQTEGRWDYVYSALHSSSFVAMGPVMRWFTGNIGFHHVHHLNAKIPFYRLPEAMAGLAELQGPATITLRPGDIMACLRLKLWDAEACRLVAWPLARVSRQATTAA
jgi:omega-6 fatty acid desaturase (delta-12 desaturase)